MYRKYFIVVKELICDNCGVQTMWFEPWCPHCHCTNGHGDE